MQLSDRVHIRFPDGREEQGTIADLDAASVLVRRAGPEGGALVVARLRLEPAGPRRWILSLWSPPAP